MKRKVTHLSSTVWFVNSFSTPEWKPFDFWDLLLVVLSVYSAAASESFSIYFCFPLLMVFHNGCPLLLQSLGKLLISCFPFTICAITLLLDYSCIACTLVLMWPVVLSLYHHRVSNMPFISNSFRSHILQNFVNLLEPLFCSERECCFSFVK